MEKEVEKGLKFYKKLGGKRLRKMVKRNPYKTKIMDFYYKRHEELAQETDFGENNYRLHFMSHVIMILAAYESLLSVGYKKEDACDWMRSLQEPIGKLAGKMYNFLDFFPFGYKFIRQSLMNDMTGEDGKNFVSEFPKDDETGFSYIIHKCVYVETFKKYGYPELIRVCCDNDYWCFQGMHRHVKWTRVCNVGDKEGVCCHDVFEKIVK